MTLAMRFGTRSLELSRIIQEAFWLKELGVVVVVSMMYCSADPVSKVEPLATLRRHTRRLRKQVSLGKY